jgi:hypothetical protein
VHGPKLRIRPESFADHYSQARQFYISQMPIEQGHIAAALTFELSKVETPAIRARMVSHLLNIDANLGEKVAAGLRLRELSEPAPAAVPTRMGSKESPALSIILVTSSPTSSQNSGSATANSSCRTSHTRPERGSMSAFTSGTPTRS